MVEAGWDVTLIAQGGPWRGIPGPHREGPDPGLRPYDLRHSFPVHRISLPPVRGLGTLLFGRRVATWLRQLPGVPDLLYARHPYSLFFARNMGIPMVLELHGLPSNPLERWVVGQLLKHPGYLFSVVISEALCADLMTAYPHLKRDEITVEHDGADARWAELPMPEGDPSGRVRVGYVGHLYRGRGVEVIAATAAELPDISFEIVGGTEADLARWRSQVTPPNLTFRGFVAPAEVPLALQRMDILLAPYQARVLVAGGRGETSRWMSPLKVFEYMASGRPMVVSDLPVLRECLEAGETALMVNPTDTSAWVKAIRQLAGDSALRRRLGTAARAMFLEHHTWDARTNRILHRVENALSSRS